MKTPQCASPSQMTAPVHLSFFLDPLFFAFKACQQANINVPISCNQKLCWNMWVGDGCYINVQRSLLAQSHHKVIVNFKDDTAS